MNRKSLYKNAGVIAYALGLLLLLPSFIRAQDVQLPSGWSDGYVYANGIRIHYYRAQKQTDKPVMVMVHGVTDNGLCWTTLAQQFEDSYDIYMLDARGHGLSDPFTTADDGQTLIKDVVGFVQSMEFQNPILVGHSMGAATVMRLGALYPTIGRAIIMLDPLLRERLNPAAEASQRPTNNRQTTARSTTPAAAADDKKISVSMFGSPEALVRQNNYSMEDLITLGRRQNPKWDEVDIQYWALSKKQYHGPYTDHASQAMRGTMEIGDALAQITVPAMILKADASAEMQQKDNEIASVMTKGKLIHIAGGGHNLHHDQLALTTEAMQQFLATLPSVK